MIDHNYMDNGVLINFSERSEKIRRRALRGGAGTWASERTRLVQQEPRPGERVAAELVALGVVH